MTIFGDSPYEVIRFLDSLLESGCRDMEGEVASELSRILLDRLVVKLDIELDRRLNDQLQSRLTDQLYSQVVGNAASADAK